MKGLSFFLPSQAPETIRPVQSGERPGGRALVPYCAFHFLDDGFTDSLYLLLPFLAMELHLSFSQVGLLKAVFSGSTGLFQLPLSLLGEKVGELTVIAGGIFGLAGGFLLLSFVGTFPSVLFALAFAKGSMAGQHGLSSSVLSKVFEWSGRRAAMGTYNFAGDLGKVCLPFLLAVLINVFGWRTAVLLLSAGGLGVGGVLVTLAKKMEIRSPLPEAREKEPREKGNRWGIRDKRGFSALLAIGILDISTRSVLLTFLPFLLLQKGWEAGRVGFALTLLFAGGAAGKFSCGILAEWFGVIPMVVVTEAMTAAGILALLWASPSWVWFLLPLVGVVLNGTSSVLYATVAEIITPEGRARGYGVYYAVTLGSGAVAPLVYGWVTDGFGLFFSLVAVAGMALFTLPLSRFLSPPVPSSLSRASEKRD